MNEPEYTLTEVVDLERPARHETSAGHVDYIYDGINFWCERVGTPCPAGPGETLPRKGWRHKPDCRCSRCREARKLKRAAARHKDAAP